MSLLLCNLVTGFAVTRIIDSSSDDSNAGIGGAFRWFLTFNSHKNSEKIGIWGTNSKAKKDFRETQSLNYSMEEESTEANLKDGKIGNWKRKRENKNAEI